MAEELEVVVSLPAPPPPASPTAMDAHDQPPPPTSPGVDGRGNSENNAPQPPQPPTSQDATMRSTDASDTAQAATPVPPATGNPTSASTSATKKLGGARDCSTTKTVVEWRNLCEKYLRGDYKSKAQYLREEKINPGKYDAFSGWLKKYKDGKLDKVQPGRKRIRQSSRANNPGPPAQVPKRAAPFSFIPGLTVTFVTGNAGKLQEVKQILNRSGFPFDLTNKKIDLPELQGDPEEVAREKCRLAAQQTDGPVMVEDTSLGFTAYNGLPGVYIKWFLDKVGHEGLNNMLEAYSDKSATAVCIFALSPGRGQDIVVFKGETHGKIVPARGPTDFGWDPIFEPDEGEGKTYAQMEKEAKNAISHRYRALQKLRDYVVNNKEVIEKANE